MELTKDQRRVVDHESGVLRVSGVAGSGRTTALVERHAGLVARGVVASRILVVCHDGAAANRFRAALVPRLVGGFDTLPMTTVAGFALDLARDAGGDDVAIATAPERRLVVRELLAGSPPAAWEPFVRRRAFADDVTRAIARWHQAGLEAADAPGRWADVAAVAGAYDEHLARRGLADWDSLVLRAIGLVEREQEPAPFDHILVDDLDRFTPAGRRLVAALARTATSACTTQAITISRDDDDVEAGADVVLRRSFRSPRPGELVRCSHPAVEPEAVAGEILAARKDGVAWRDMAVLVREPRRRGRSIARALARHGVPVASHPALAADEPVVRAIVDVLRWAAGDASAFDRLLVSPIGRLDPAEVRRIRARALGDGADLEAQPELAHLGDLRDEVVRRKNVDDPAALAYLVWERGLGHLVASGDDRALDAVVAFLDGLAAEADRRPGVSLEEWVGALDDADLVIDPWRARRHVVDDAVTITSIAAAAGREWHTVVVAGCVEGELPRLRSAPAFFDPALLEGPGGEDRRRRALEDQRRLFQGLACTRATHRLVGTAGPHPGVLLSRFVEAWPEHNPLLPFAPGLQRAARAPTEGQARCAPEGNLTLSATQLDTYDDCPLRYQFDYVVGVRSEAGPQAALGTMVHAVLARFCDPHAGVPTSRDALFEIAEDVWRDDIARFRPQLDEARRDFVDMLQLWWDHEGCRLGDGLEVLAVERRFEVSVGGHLVRGAIDRIDRADDGEGIRIVDYKTGSHEPAAADIEADLQLAVYHLAAGLDPELVDLGPPTQLCLLYLRKMHRHEQPIRADHAEITRQRILESAERILAEDFEPSPHATCRWCSYQRLCPLWPEGREVALA